MRSSCKTELQSAEMQMEMNLEVLRSLAIQRRKPWPCFAWLREVSLHLYTPYTFSYVFAEWYYKCLERIIST